MKLVMRRLGEGRVSYMLAQVVHIDVAAGSRLVYDAAIILLDGSQEGGHLARDCSRDYRRLLAGGAEETIASSP